MKPLRGTREKVVGCRVPRPSSLLGNVKGSSSFGKEGGQMPYHAPVLRTQWLIRMCVWSLVLLFVQPTLAVCVQNEATLKGTPLTHPLRQFDGDPRLLAKLLDAEQTAVKRQIELYSRKVSIIRALLAQFEEDSDAVSLTKNNSSSTKQQEAQAKRIARQHERQRSYQHQQQKAGGVQRFSDWFAFHSSHSVALPSPDATKTCHDTEIKSHAVNRVRSTRMDLLSFRPNANPTSKKNHAAIQPGRAPKTRHAGSLGHSASSWPLLQFLLVFDMARGHMDLLHPTTKELVWQHAMFDHVSSASSRTRIVDYFFTSERMSYFATLSENGGISLYKLRVLHNKRLLSGDHRRQGRFDVAMCMLRSPHHYAHVRETNWMGVPLLVPWRTSAKATTSPATNYLHVDFDLIFRTTGRDDGGNSNTVEREEFRDGKIAVVTFYTQAYVIAATARGEISFFHGANGTFIKTIDATHNGNQGVSTRTGSITQFKVMASGIVAFASGNRIQFINAHDQTTVRGVACEASLTDTITSIESDPWRHSTIYAGTSSGRGLVFRLVHFDQMRRKRKSAQVAGVETEEDESEPSCVLVDQLLPKQRMLPSYLQLPSNGHHQQHQTALSAIPGYLIMATNTETVLYRTSHDDMGPAYIAEHTHTPQLSSNSAWLSSDNATSGLSSKADFVIGISIGKEPNVHPASLAVHYAAIEAIANCSSLMPSSYRVDIYESLLPQLTSSLDLGWLRAPIMLLCAVGVMYWQQRQHTRNLSAQGLPPGFDLARFSEMAKR